jgi:hypothetical protein
MLRRADGRSGVVYGAKDGGDKEVLLFDSEAKAAAFISGAAQRGTDARGWEPRLLDGPMRVGRFLLDSKKAGAALIVTNPVVAGGMIMYGKVPIEGMLAEAMRSLEGRPGSGPLLKEYARSSAGEKRE